MSVTEFGETIAVAGGALFGSASSEHRGSVTVGERVPLSRREHVYEFFGAEILPPPTVVDIEKANFCGESLWGEEHFAW